MEVIPETTEISSYMPPEILLMFKGYLKIGVLIIGIILLVLHLIKAKKLPFMIVSIIMIIASIMTSSVNILINMIVIHGNQEFNNLYYFNEFHPITKIVFYLTCFIFTIFSCSYLRKYYRNADKNNKETLLTILLGLWIAYTFLPSIQAWII